MRMAAVSVFIFFSLFYSLIPYSAEEESIVFNNCPPFSCGDHNSIATPFTDTKYPANCGPFEAEVCSEELPTPKLSIIWGAGRWYDNDSISHATIRHTKFQRSLNSSLCASFNNLSPPTLPYASIEIKPNLSLYECKYNVSVLYPPPNMSPTNCKDLSIYYAQEDDGQPHPRPDCQIVEPQFGIEGSYAHKFGMLTAKFSLECYGCQSNGNQCQINGNGDFQCVNKGGKHLAVKLGLGLGVPAAMATMIFLFTMFFIRHRYNRRSASSDFLSANNSVNPSSKSYMDGSNVLFGVPIFSYSELEEATNRFDSKNELGNGGFGTVYYGKLRDGREVAVKRLYEHNYKRVERFMNEIEILTCLHHKNLVSLYGCTSRHSHELLLVYEYIPNGTVADHLHGNRAMSDPLTWPVRMRIAIETASALAYLHVSDIIHRDVKTNNILLDNNFCVKVADFGLSRLFPNDVTHVSTVPQGTPGYIDPEYHQCYQLTSKSDVYSFGVFLVELISSMPAVDMNRHRHEINLANLAIDKIQKCAFDEIIDPHLGYKSDGKVKRMTTFVAELAFRCLQLDKEVRPSMDEVLEELKRIESGEYE